MALPSLPFLVLDTETTGFVPRVHRVIEFAGVRIDGGKKEEEFEQLLSIGKDEIPPHVQVLTAIKPENVTGKPMFRDILPKIQAMFTPETIIVGQNIGFDLGMLKGEGLDLTNQPWIDTSMLASIVFPELKSYSLVYLSQVLKLDHEPRHRAMGDVRATIELLEKCCERLAELPASSIRTIQAFAQNGPEGYRRFFSALKPKGGKTENPEWLRREQLLEFDDGEKLKATIECNPLGTVELIEESLDRNFLHRLLKKIETVPGPQFVAVKNLDATLRRIKLPKDTQVLYPPEALLAEESTKTLLSQPIFTADELTLAIKLALYEPTVRSLIPLHGEERQVWSGKIAATRASHPYRQQWKSLSGLTLLDHQELLHLLSDENDGPAIPLESRIVIDDATMLEDTATNAYSWICSVPALRASASGHELLTKLVDLLELWAEKTRAATDIHYITLSDLAAREASGLRTQVDALIGSDIPRQAVVMLENLKKILSPSNLDQRICFIELYMDRSLNIKSVPERVSTLLKDKLYSRYATSLIVPPDSADTLAAILPRGQKSQCTALPDDERQTCVTDLRLGEKWNTDAFLRGAAGKNVLLLSSKRAIEDLYVKHFVDLDQAGITLICQGLSGGQGRMQAEFAAASSPAILVLTPWMYETMELPHGTIDQLVITALPFDHPSHPIIGRRGDDFRDPFNEYTLPRVKHRLWRLLRTFCRHASAVGSMAIVDERLRTKEYGRGLKEYLNAFVREVESERMPSEKPMQMPLL